MEQNGSHEVERVDYPWKNDILKPIEDVDKEKYLAAVKCCSNVKPTKQEDPMIWEVYEGKVTELAKEKKQWENETPYCRFYNDRAYVVLSCHDAAIKSIYDIHFWVSKHCSRDDYMLANIMVDQLNLKLDEIRDEKRDEKPIIHREIQLQESDTFHSYFKIEVRRRPKDPKVHSSNPKLDKCCLLQFRVEEAGVKGKKRQWMVERKFLRGNLLSEDVFVIMNEHFIYQWNGTNSNEWERKAAQAYIKQKEANSTLRFKPPVINEAVNDRDHSVYNLFPTTGKKPKAITDEKEKIKVKRLYKVDTYADRNGETKYVAKEDEKTASKSNLSSEFVYFLDTASQLFVWIGDSVTPSNKSKAIFLAEDFLETEYNKLAYKKYEQAWNKPRNKSITLVNEENYYHLFDRALLH